MRAHNLCSVMKSGIKVFAPASVSNVCCGFDVLGFALEGVGDEIVGNVSDEPGLRIVKITGDNKKLSLNLEQNTAGIAAMRVLEHLGAMDVGIELTLRKKMPIGSGLGSSAASAVAGAMIVNEMLRRPLTKRELLPFAMEGEKLASGAYHCDNVAPSLLGGMMMSRDNATFEVHRIYTPRGLYATIVYPEVEVLTTASRALLSPTVPLQGMVQQTANIAGLIIGMTNGDFDLIKRSLHDAVIEPQRAHLVPHFAALKAAAMDAGALGCSISGSGPSVFALSQNSKIAEEVEQAFREIYTQHAVAHQTWVSPINNEGAALM